MHGAELRQCVYGNAERNSGAVLGDVLNMYSSYPSEKGEGVSMADRRKIEEPV